MRRFVLGLSISIAFILGCAASQLVVPPVRAGTNPVKWEYLCLPGSITPENAMAKFNKAGAEGWEVSIVDPGAGYCFKRPLP